MCRIDRSVSTASRSVLGGIGEFIGAVGVAPIVASFPSGPDDADFYPNVHS